MPISRSEHEAIESNDRGDCTGDADEFSANRVLQCAEVSADLLAHRRSVSSRETLLAECTPLSVRAAARCAAARRACRAAPRSDVLGVSCSSVQFLYRAADAKANGRFKLTNYQRTRVQLQWVRTHVPLRRRRAVVRV